jgi:hypothetical protein
MSTFFNTTQSESIRVGYWSLNPYSPEVLCPLRERACLGGSVATCTSDLTGFLCNEPIDTQLFIDLVGREVMECSNPLIMIPSIVLPIFSLCLFFYFTCLNFKRPAISSRKTWKLYHIRQQEHNQEENGMISFTEKEWIILITDSMRKLEHLVIFSYFYGALQVCFIL